jgi:DNA-binding transcriptional MerR regulator
LKAAEMPRKRNGVKLKTIADAASELGVSTTSLRRYITKGLLPKPKRMFFGTQSYQVFDDKYIEDASKKIAAVREQ